ncbi:MAG: DUF5320 domain-containing protein [Candidatus Hermodarchaeota archaeon]
MPGGDKTGPRGLGSRTGRGLGYCAGYDAPGSMYGPGFGLGRGRGRGIAWKYGRGRGYGRGWAYRELIYPPLTPYAYRAPAYTSRPLEPVDKLEMLKQEKSYLESELKGISSVLEDISKSIEDLEKNE